MRTINTTLVAVKPLVAVLPACLSPRDDSVSNAGFVASVFSPSAASRSAATAMPSWQGVTARPTSRVEATGVGFADTAAAETRRGAGEFGRDVPGTAARTRLIGINDGNGNNGKQQDQLHLMSRRDPRTWRPPA